MRGGLLKISTSEAYEEEFFFRRGSCSFRRGFPSVRHSAERAYPPLPSRMRAADGKGGGEGKGQGLREDLFPVINLRGLARATPAGGESRGASRGITVKTRRVPPVPSSPLLSFLLMRRLCAPRFSHTRFTIIDPALSTSECNFPANDNHDGDDNNFALSSHLAMLNR